MDIDELLINLICTIVGGLLGSGITVRTIRMKQKAGDNAQQIMSGKDSTIK